MYDYRQDVINLMQKTQDTKESLDQSIIALDILLKVYKDQDKKAQAEINNQTDSTDKFIEDKNIETEKSTDSEAKDTSSNLTQLAKPAELKILKKNHDFENLKPDEFRIVRRMSGAVAVDSTNQQIAYFSETEVRDSNLQNHDIVQLGGFDDAHDQPYILNIQHDPRPDNLTEFGPAPIERHLLDSTSLIVRKDINNKQLSMVNSAHTFYEIPFEYSQRLDLKEGDIVNLVWNTDNPDNIKIRWVYRDEPDFLTSPAPSTKSKYKTSQPKDEKYTSTLNFDLNGQTVGLLSAEDSIMSNLSKVVTAHNGKPTVITLKSASISKQKTQEFDIIILMQSYIKHTVSQSAIAEAKSANTKIAMSQTAGQLSLEKALYRANNNLNVVDSPTIIYPQAE